MTSPNLSDIITTTLANRSAELADNVRKNNAILYHLGRKNRIKTAPGGRSIYQALSYQENGNKGWYSGADLLPVAAADVLTTAEFAWKQHAVPVVITGLEEMQNSGEDAVFSLIDERMDVAESSMANDIAAAMYGDGTGSGGKEIGGLDLLVPQDPTTGTAGGINRASWTFWRSQLYDPASTPISTTIQAYMTTLWFKCLRGADKPDLIMAGTTIGTTYINSLQANIRFTDNDLADAGFDNVKFFSAPVVVDGGIGGNATATDMYYLNSKYLFFRPHAQRNMVPIGKNRMAVNQDASVSMLGFMGNMTSNGLQFQGRFKGD